MSGSSERTLLKVVTVGDFDPGADAAIEYDFIGRVIAGRYTVRAQIGGGGMADVFRATDEELGVDVAIKLLKPRMASDELRARMVQEARAAAQIRHPNLVRVFGTGKLDSTAYIVMELLDGPNLEQYLHEYRDQRIPWREALELMLPALAALHAVHMRGYVHRDIKTGNILVTREAGHPPWAVVIDLGLVKPDRALRNAASPPTTEVGRLLCTPGYTSPEQAAGLPVDRRSDVYSMAVTLYRVLAGRLPFHDARGQPMMFVLAKHIYNQPTPLCEAGAGADIPPAIAAVIEAALRKQPGERPQSMLDFAEALRAAAASVDASPAAGPRRGWLRGLPLGFALGAAFAGIAALGLVRRVQVQAAPGGAGVSARGDEVTVGAAEPATELWCAPAVDGSDEPRDDGGERTADSPRPGPALEREGPRPVVRTARRPPPAARAIAGRQAAVQRCADDDAGSSDRLAVAVDIDASGRIHAHAVGAPDSTLSRCLDRVLRDAVVAAPREPTSFVHTFKLRALPDTP